MIAIVERRAVSCLLRDIMITLSSVPRILKTCSLAVDAWRFAIPAWLNISPSRKAIALCGSVHLISLTRRPCPRTRPKGSFHTPSVYSLS